MIYNTITVYLSTLLRNIETIKVMDALVEHIENAKINDAPFSAKPLVSNKRLSLEKFIDRYAHLPKQGTNEWRESRHDFIGGSEISTLLKRNKYKTVNKLILERLNITPFTGSAATYWGNVFEPLIRNHSNRIFKCFIRETGSIPYAPVINDDPIYTNLSYSPDGLAVVQYKDFKKYIDTISFLISLDTDVILEDFSEFIVLFEFKCPHSRVPDGDVPDHYISQPSIGMHIINICEISIFIEAIFRKCLFKDLYYNNKYVAWGHYNKVQFEDMPIECGFMMLYTRDCDLYNEIFQDLQDCGVKKIKQLFDLGTLDDKDVFDNIMKNCVSHDIEVDLTFNHVYNQDIFTEIKYTQDLYNKALYDSAIKHLENKKLQLSKIPIIGVLPYKLLKTYINPIYKEKDFITKNNLIYKSGAIIDFIRTHKDTPTAELKKILRQTYLI